MATREETSRLRTLADVVSQPAASEPLAVPTGIRGFDVNKVSDDDGVVVVSKRVVQTTEMSVEKRMVGPVFGLDNEKVGDVQAQNVSVNGESSKEDVVDLGPGGKFQVVQNGGKVIDDLNDEGGRVVEMDGEKGCGDDVESVEVHGYSVGDLVWGKIKSHPWWPGQIYDPKDATDYALKFNQKGRLLVAYFGDGSFAWCLRSQLIPFAEHFEYMSKQSSSKSFINAVQEAVDEIGRLVELEMTCKCVPEENREGLNSLLAANAGIKAGVLVPEGDIGKLLSFRYDSAELLATVENIAQCVSFGSVLELAILKSWLSAFYRARGGYLLPTYHEGLQIEGLEDRNRNGHRNTGDFGVPVEVPIKGPLEEAWPSAIAGSENGPAPSEDKIYHRRKQKSVAELLAEDTVKKSNSRKKSVAREGTNASNSAKQRKKVDDEAENQSGSIHASVTVRKRGRKKTEEISNAENGHAQPEEEMHKKSLLGELEKDEITVGDYSDGEGPKGSEDISSPRERKKSKYLSPPYTSPRFRDVNPFSKKGLEKELEKIRNITRMGERMTKAAGILLESPPIVKCNDQTLEEKLPEGSNDGQLDSYPPGGKQVQKKIIEIMDVNTPVNEVLAGVISIAGNPLHSWNDRLFDLIRGFICAFRSSIYLNGANYKIYHKRQRSRKRKSLSCEQENLGNGDAKSPAAKARRTVGGKSTQDKSDTPKRKKTATGPVVKSNDKQIDRNASPASLVVTFAPGFSLPSKDDIIRTFGKFGVLNEKETAVYRDSACIQIVYTSPSGAEEALRASLRHSPFGSASVNYKLCYHSAASMAVESSYNTSSPIIKTPDKPVASQSTADEKSQLSSIRQKLEIMTSMLEKCDGKIPTKEVSKLDRGIKPLFEKVKKIAEAASY